MNGVRKAKDSLQLVGGILLALSLTLTGGLRAAHSLSHAGGGDATPTVADAQPGPGLSGVDHHALDVDGCLVCLLVQRPQAPNAAPTHSLPATLSLGGVVPRAPPAQPTGALRSYRSRAPPAPAV